MRVLRLDPTHAAVVRALRLRALKEVPTAFLASYEEDVVRWTEDHVREQLAKPPGTAMFGAFVNDVLVGMVGLYRDESRAKARHRARIWGVYVTPAARGLGIARALMDAAIDEARNAGIAHLELTVAAPQIEARALYERIGFRSIGTIPNAMRVDENDIDEDFMVLAL